MNSSTQTVRHTMSATAAEEDGRKRRDDGRGLPPIIRYHPKMDILRRPGALRLIPTDGSEEAETTSAKSPEVREGHRKRHGRLVRVRVRIRVIVYETEAGTAKARTAELVSHSTSLPGAREQLRDAQPEVQRATDVDLVGRRATFIRCPPTTAVSCSSSAAADDARRLSRAAPGRGARLTAKGRMRHGDLGYSIRRCRSQPWTTRNSSPNRVLAALREAITSGRLPAEARIKQEQIAAELGVSRTPVREALHLLGAGGPRTARAAARRARAGLHGGRRARAVRAARAARARRSGARDRARDGRRARGRGPPGAR